MIITEKLKYISPEEVCEMVPGMTTAKLSQARFKGVGGPPYRKPSAKTVIYELGEVIAWIESTKRTGTAEVD